VHGHLVARRSVPVVCPAEVSLPELTPDLTASSMWACSSSAARGLRSPVQELPSRWCPNQQAPRPVVGLVDAYDRRAPRDARFTVWASSELNLEPVARSASVRPGW